MSPASGSPGGEVASAGTHDVGGDRLDSSQQAHRRHGHPRPAAVVDDEDQFLHRSLYGMLGGSVPGRSHGLDHEADQTSQEEESRVAYMAPLDGAQGSRVARVSEGPVSAHNFINSTFQPTPSAGIVDIVMGVRRRRVTLSAVRPTGRAATYSAIVARNLGSPGVGGALANQNARIGTPPGSLLSEGHGSPNRIGSPLGTQAEHSPSSPHISTPQGSGRTVDNVRARRCLDSIMTPTSAGVN